MPIRVYRTNYNSMLNKCNYIYNFRSSVRQYIRYRICRPFWLFMAPENARSWQFMAPEIAISWQFMAPETAG